MKIRKIKPDEIVFHKRGMNNFSMDLSKAVYNIDWIFTQEIRPYWWMIYNHLYNIFSKKKKKVFRPVKIKKHIVLYGAFEINYESQDKWKTFLREDVLKEMGNKVEEKYVYTNYVMSGRGRPITDIMDQTKILKDKYKSTHRENRLKKILE
ncbi:MAG: hypothetical protein SLAVMIC_00530 [uncultured marine phage]|uniref:Uncharacterized protein n=1 Tax=uncultured marine phage TaxID=707152 RepID=A0A8D9CA68_9VIRU|nr:MAG: hypothetical protein SLAVMIC_00530 [uncultured marine phage]